MEGVVRHDSTLLLPRTHYDELNRPVDQVVSEVATYSHARIQQVLDEAQQGDHSLELVTAYGRLFSSISGDKPLCAMLGVRDYNALPSADIDRIRAAAYMLAKKDPNTIPYVLKN